MSMIAMALLAASSACPAQSAVLDAAAAAVTKTYVDESRAAAIAAALRQWARDGRYADSCAAPRNFVDQLNRDLDMFDGHFHVDPPSGGASDDWLTAWRAESRTVNAGIREARVLEGNVGYIRISSFYPWDLAKPKLAAAFALVGDADALIIDLRQNGGGDEHTTNQLLAALVGKPTPAVQWIETRAGRKADPLPAPELPPVAAGKRLAVLIDRRSGSASEFIAYSLQALERAVVVGSRSGGVANLVGEPVPLPHGYAISIPDSRPVNMATKSNWEGTGVQPDLRGGDDPLFVARQLLAPPQNGARQGR